MSDTDAITILSPGSLITSTGSNAVVALPTNQAGTTTRYVRLICPVPTDYCYVLPGYSDTVVTATNGLAINAYESVTLNVAGCTHLAVLQGSAAGKLNVIPIEG